MARDNFISLHGSEGELVDDRFNTYKVELQSWCLEQVWHQCQNQDVFPAWWACVWDRLS